MFRRFSNYLSQDIAIDLGTANSLVYVRGRGIVITEPSVVAINQKTGQILAIGNEAKKMVGRTPAHIVATRPLVRGVISDFEVTEQMLRYFIERVSQRKLFMAPRLRVIIGIPCGVTEVEKKAVIDAAKSAGAGAIYLIEEPMAAAIGARLQVQEAGGNFVVDIGGGTTEVAVISLGGIVLAKSLRIAGDKLNEDIINFSREEYKLVIGERTAEAAKIGIGSAYIPNGNGTKNGGAPRNGTKSKKSAAKNPENITRTEGEGAERNIMPIRGRNMVTGLPEEIIVTKEDIRRAMEKSVRRIVDEIKTTVEETPPELLADIMTKGIYLSGGGALLRGLDTLVAKETKMPVSIVDDPLTAVVRGAGMVIEHIDELQEVLVETGQLEPPR
ncbi:MAG: rod shape-determining protein [Candidatus Wildermuthbacteria bacterium RIFCSPLOWO2_02_FULL_47_10]|uniref:Cell shape-determining protein MreB n=1 Tax=Candidatus Wildermuthbacteria bacterium RIFCSPHIGHO2_02_FULL_47_17 TaxID=1802452 RepID=A0A1G2R6Q6_9BACT|nr:MAG: rod shape-determining protein [Candidatus Wildermuthbacteria bacterium RIFCSPHIGHO2_02_FULL_47_17]OHA75633.1 MAG: rod shape-determining protein [Candidatus Wildermuthbacteria bacterium RIFCSPLOWO2_02_FULL_47_10]